MIAPGQALPRVHMMICCPEATLKEGKPAFKHEIRRQISVYFETLQTVIQSTPMADFSFDFAEGSFLLLNSQEHLRSVPKDLIGNKQKGTKRIYQKRQRHGHYKTLKPIFLNKS